MQPRRPGSTGPALQHPKPQNPFKLAPVMANSPPPPEQPLQSNNYERFSSPPIQNAQHASYGYANQQPLQPQPQAFLPQQQPPVNYWGGGGAQGAAGPSWANDATAQMGMQFGRSAVQAGTDYVEKNFTRHLPISHLQHSFNVSNLYVLKKIRLVLFPWRHKPWSRMARRSETSGQTEGYRPPREDINSPDLYIPVMALVTYILLSGIVAGSQSRFGPELLGLAASRALGIVFLEFCIIKLGTYLLNIGGEGTVVDLFAYSGYKFVGIIVTLTTGLLQLRSWVYWTTFLYTFLANFFFLLRSLRYVVLPDPGVSTTAFDPNANASSITHAQRNKRIQFLFGVAAAQSLSMWFLTRV